MVNSDSNERAIRIPLALHAHVLCHPMLIKLVYDVRDNFVMRRHL